MFEHTTRPEFHHNCVTGAGMYFRTPEIISRIRIGKYMVAAMLCVLNRNTGSVWRRY